MESVNMNEKPDQKSSHISTTVNIIRKRPPKDLISQKREEIERRVKRLEKHPKHHLKTGTILLSHVPPAFSERAIKEYFEQFGNVNHVKLGRSQKTGRVKGYAFVQFEHEIVAKIVAETMNNYILFNRLLKARVLDSKSFLPGFWRKIDLTKTWKVRGKKLAKESNKTFSERAQNSRLRARFSNLNNMIEKLKLKGITYSYELAIGNEVEDTSSIPGKFVRRPDSDDETEEISQNIEDESNITMNDQKAVLEIDESDEDIVFMTPPNVIKKKLSSTESQTLSLNSSKLKKFKVKSRRTGRRIASEKKKNNSEDVSTKLKKNLVLKKDRTNLKNKRSNELKVTKVKKEKTKDQNEQKSEESNELEVNVVKKTKIKTQNETKSEKTILNKMKRKWHKTKQTLDETKSKRRKSPKKKEGDTTEIKKEKNTK